MSLTYSTTTGLSDTKALGVKDGGYYYIYFVNNGLANVSLTLALSSLGVGAGWPVVIERVNASSYGEVTEVANTTSTGGVALVGECLKRRGRPGMYTFGREFQPADASSARDAGPFGKPPCAKHGLPRADPPLLPHPRGRWQ